MISNYFSNKGATSTRFSISVDMNFNWCSCIRISCPSSKALTISFIKITFWWRTRATVYQLNIMVPVPIWTWISMCRPRNLSVANYVCSSFWNSVIITNKSSQICRGLIHVFRKIRYLVYISFMFNSDASGVIIPISGLPSNILMFYHLCNFTIRTANNIMG